MWLQRCITVAKNTAADADANNTNKKVVFTNCTSFTTCISRINNTQVDDAQYIDAVMPMQNLIEYKENNSKTSGVLFHCCRDVPVLYNDGKGIDFTEANVTDY